MKDWEGKTCWVTDKDGQLKQEPYAEALEMFYTNFWGFSWFAYYVRLWFLKGALDLKNEYELLMHINTEED